MDITADTIKYESKNTIKRFLINRFKQELLTLVKLTQARHVLDVGCGEGYLLKFLNDQINDWCLEGLDISEELISKAKQKAPSLNLNVQDIYNCGYSDGSFDLVLCTEMLEHLEYPKKALSEIRRLTNRWAILSVPNEPLFAISNLLAGRDILRLGNNKGHCNRWSAKSFVGLVSRHFRISCVYKPFPWTIVLCEK